jgi:transposase
MRPCGSPQQSEARRRHAIRWLKSGRDQAAVARRLGVSPSSVYRWWQSYQQAGSDGLKPRPTPGRPPKLSDAQKQELVGLLLKGPLAAGFATDLWTLTRINRVIRRHFGIHYHPSHVWRVLTDMKWSCQKPERRALQRNEADIAHWRRYRWPHIKKGAPTWRPADSFG